MKTDYTKQRKSKSIQVCPKCGKKGLISYRFLYNSYVHTSEDSKFFRHIKEYCDVVNEPEQKYFNEVKKAFSSIPSMAKVMHHHQEQIEADFRVETPVKGAIETVVDFWIERHEKAIEKRKKEIKELKEIIQS